jgi:putative two-component system response regulator
MPGMSGLDVMARMAETIRNDYLPVLVLTSETDQEIRLQALALGAKDFITKPFQKAEVLHRIRNMIEVRLLYRRARWSREIVEAQVRERTQQLHQTQLDIIRRLATAGEFRDNETGMHVLRMSLSCQRLAAEAGLDRDACELILHARAFSTLIEPFDRSSFTPWHGAFRDAMRGIG